MMAGGRPGAHGADAMLSAALLFRHGHLAVDAGLGGLLAQMIPVHDAPELLTLRDIHAPDLVALPVQAGFKEQGHIPGHDGRGGGGGLRRR